MRSSTLPPCLTQVNAIQVRASLLRHIHIHVEQDHRVPKVLPGARIQHQHGIVGRGAGGRLLLPEPCPQFGARGAARGVRQDGHDCVCVT